MVRARAGRRASARRCTSPRTASAGPPKTAVAGASATGEVLLLENTRFHPAKRQQRPGASPPRSPRLAMSMCNDAFSAAHRAHASTEAIARLLPACAGRLMAGELSALEAALGTPDRPVVAVVGGAKVSTKLDLLATWSRKVDHLVIGGGMANTFLAAKGIDVGKSLCEHDMADTAREILAERRDGGLRDRAARPTWWWRANSRPTRANEVVAADACPPDAMILDAGPETVARYRAALFDGARTLIWNGPLGVFEIEPFDAATFGCRAQGRRSRPSGQPGLGRRRRRHGGGAQPRRGQRPDFTYISTAGGAFLEWMEGKTLPGVAALNA